MAGTHKELLSEINKVKDKVKKSKVYQDLCKEYGVDIDYIDLVPMAFDDFDVSARTNQGCIYFNKVLLEDGEFDREDHYMIHEFAHHMQQCFGDGPTQGSTSDNYLDNKFEQDSFKTQTEYLSETRGDEVAKEYIEQVMEHHDVPDKEKENRRKDLLNLAINILEAKQYKKAGLFKVPKAWVDRLEGPILGFYASQVWLAASKLFKEYNENVKIKNVYEQLEMNSGPLQKFYDFFGNPEVTGSAVDKKMDMLSSLEIGRSIYISADDGVKSSTLLKPLFMTLKVEKIGDDEYDVVVSYPSESMGREALAGLLERGSFINDYEELLKTVNYGDKQPAVFEEEIRFKGNLSKTLTFLDWAGEDILYNLYIPYLKNYVTQAYPEPDTAADLLFLIKECKQYTQAPADTAIDQFYLEINLDDVVNDLALYSDYFKDINLSRYKDNIVKALIVARRWPHHIKVNTNVNEFVKYQNNGEEDTALGMWQPGTKEILISFNLPVSQVTLTKPMLANYFKKSVFDARNTIRHELQHMAQSIIKDIKGLSEEAGLTKQKIRSKDVDIHGRTNKDNERIEHGLRDIEFYTDLTDAIENFKRKTLNWPNDLKTEYSKLFVGEPNQFIQFVFDKQFSKDRAKKMQEWQISLNLDSLKRKHKPDSFFETLRNRDMPRWKIAVREFMKAIQ